MNSLCAPAFGPDLTSSNYDESGVDRGESVAGTFSARHINGPILGAPWMKLQR